MKSFENTMIKHGLLGLMLLSISSCIGTDVVDVELVEERLAIDTRLTSLAVGESYQFMADYFNNLGEEEMATVNWSSNNEGVISISAEGLAEAHMLGEATITAEYLGAEDMVTISASDQTVEMTARTGSFMGANNYSVNGDFNLSEENGQLLLTFESNFQASTGPGLFIFLSNSPNSITGALEVGAIQASRGEQVYPISLAKAGLNTYDYVLVWCKPFGVLFGRGRFDN